MERHDKHALPLLEQSHILIFPPFHCIPVWKEPETTTTCVTTTNVLLLELSRGEFSVFVLDGRRELKPVLYWIKTLQNLHLLQGN